MRTLQEIPLLRRKSPAEPTTFGLWLAAFKRQGVALPALLPVAPLGNIASAARHRLGCGLHARGSSVPAISPVSGVDDSSDNPDLRRAPPGGVHHWFTIYPFPHMAIGSAIAYLAGPPSGPDRRVVHFVSTLFVTLALVVNMVTVEGYGTLMRRTGGTG